MTNITPVEEVRTAIVKMQPQFAMVLPSHISPDKFQRVALTAIQNTPALLEADRRSLYAACMKSAQDGLLPDGREAALVVFNTKAGKLISYMPMVGGLLKKIRQSGDLATLHAAVVYEKDNFRYWVDSNGQHIEHEPVLFGERGKPIGVYAMAKTKDGSIFIQPLSIAEVDKIRAVSRSKDSGPWVSWWDEMAKKSAIRRLSKYLPQSADLDRSLHADDDLFAPEEPQTINQAKSEPIALTADVEEKPKRRTRLAAVKEAAQTQAQATAEDMPPIPESLNRQSTRYDANTGDVIPPEGSAFDADEDVI